MSKQEVHDGYKKIIAHMLMTFYLDVQNVSDSFETVKHLHDYVDHWVAANIKSPHEDWKPGDCGK